MYSFERELFLNFKLYILGTGKIKQELKKI